LIILDGIVGWKETVWNVELDDFYCCSGRSYYDPCGCMGTTNREQIYWQYLGKRLRDYSQFTNEGDKK
jgi:hypothetical protein